MGQQLRAGIVGGTGYAGAELLRLLAAHPCVEIAEITSRADSGKPVEALFPNLRGRIALAFSSPDAARLDECDVVFFATPHGVAMEGAARLLDAGVKVVDLSADFRLRDATQWARWYGQAHTSPQWLAQAVYGLPELNRQAIRGARLVAAPGCYPTAVQLGLIPLLEAGVVDPGSLVASAASGVSGAGRQASIDNLLAECGDSFKAYSVAGHRHLPEIEQGLQQCTSEPVQLSFVPHLAPMVRGIHATLFARLRDRRAELQAIFERRYSDEPAVDVMPAGSHPQTRSVRGANLCRIAVHLPQDRDTVIVLAVIDNLVKGAAGQAVQCMNLMCGFEETAGLAHAPLAP